MIVVDGRGCESECLSRAAYFDTFPNVWAHGALAEITSRGRLLVSGRSDSVLNPGGVRIGTAEIYRLLEQLPEIEESIAVGREMNDDVAIVLFLKMRSGRLTEETVLRVKSHIRSGATPRHVPAEVYEVCDVPRTKTGKIVELAVKNVINGFPVANLAAIANPECLVDYEKYRIKSRL